MWVAFLNNAASEQSARMNAMENASKNAGEILDKLTLQYNKARQARITIELVEIISGAAALDWVKKRFICTKSDRLRKIDSVCAATSHCDKMLIIPLSI